MFIIYLHTKFHVPCFYGFVTIAIKPAPEEHFRTTATYLLYIKQKIT
jgi:hypothetical protein